MKYLMHIHFLVPLSLFYGLTSLATMFRLIYVFPILKPMKSLHSVPYGPCLLALIMFYAQGSTVESTEVST